MDLDTYADRLAAAMGITPDMRDDERRKRMHALADRLGITYQAVKKAVSGGSGMLSASNNSKAARLLQVDSDWLAVGEGEMRSGRVWPFGLEIAPADYARLPEAVTRGALDMLKAAAERLPESGKPANGGPRKQASARS